MKWFTLHIGLSVVDEMVYPSNWFERCRWNGLPFKLVWALWMKWFTVHIGLSIVDEMVWAFVDEMVYRSHWFERCGWLGRFARRPDESPQGRRCQSHHYSHNHKVLFLQYNFNKVENFDNNHFSNHFSLVSEQNTEFFNEKTTNDFFLGFVRLSL